MQRACATTVVALLVMVALGVSSSVASAAPVDVMIAFDTTGSMQGALDEARADIQDVITSIDARFPDVAYAVSEVRDYPGLYGENGDTPWALTQPVTTDRAALQSALDGLVAGGGGDGPEAYGRGLFESDHNGAVGWRPGAQRLVVLVADSVPHDDDINAGIDPLSWAQSSPFDTGADPGPDEVIGTADDIDWQSQLASMKADGLPLYFVLYKGSSAYLPYWQTWAGITGGSASDSADGALADTLTASISAGVTGCGGSRHHVAVGKAFVCANEVDGSGNDLTARGDVRVDGAVTLGDGPVALAPSSGQIASTGIAPLGVATAGGQVALGAGAVTIDASTTVTDPVSGRSGLLRTTLIGGSLGTVPIGGLGMLPGQDLFVDPVAGGGVDLVVAPPLLSALKVNPFKLDGSFAVGFHGSHSGPEVLGGSAGVGGIHLFKGVEIGSAQLSYHTPTTEYKLPSGRTARAAPAGTWELKGDMKMPGLFAKANPALQGGAFSIALRNGSFDALSLGVKTKKIPLGATGFVLDGVAGEISGLSRGTGNPFVAKLTADGGWGGLPGPLSSIFSGNLVNIKDAGISFTSQGGMTFDGPLEGKLSARANVLDDRLAKGSVELGIASQPAHVFGSMKLDVSLTVASLHYDGSGAFTPRHFTGQGGADGRIMGKSVRSGRAVISDKGMGATSRFCLIRCVDVGVGIEWRNVFKLPPEPEWIGADVQRYVTTSAVRHGASRTVRVSRGQALLVVHAYGTSAHKPQIALVGPGGERITSARPGRSALVVRIPRRHGIALAVVAPRAGRWRVTSTRSRQSSVAVVPPVGALRVAFRGRVPRKLTRKHTAILAWSGKRLPRGTSVQVWSGTRRGALERRLATRGQRGRLRIATKQLLRGRNYLTLVAISGGVPFRSVVLRTPLRR